VVEPDDALAVVVVADPAHEQGQPARGVVVECGDHLVDHEGRLAQADEPDARRGLHHAAHASTYSRTVEILLWLVPPVLVTFVAMAWVAWVGREGRGEVDREELVRRLRAAPAGGGAPRPARLAPASRAVPRCRAASCPAA